MSGRGNPARQVLGVVVLLLALGALAGSPARPAQAGPSLAATPSVPQHARPLPLHDPLSRVAPDVLQDLGLTGRASYIVMLTTQADTHNALADWSAKGQFVYNQLRSLASASQEPLLAYLAEQQTAGHVDSYAPLWIVNAITVTSDADVLNYLASLPQVGVIWNDGAVRALGQPAGSGGGPAVVPTAEPNIVATGAPQVWALGDRGQGVVVATLDTGVEADHPALARKYRGWNNGDPVQDYNWYDAVNGQQANGPYDDAGHGTSTLGIVLGSEADESNAIGVAPDAQWIAVKMLNDQGLGTDSGALRAMQWVLAPTRSDGTLPRPDLRPQVASNAWGAVCADGVTRGAVRAWLDVGIFASFASGDDGTVAAPAAFPEALGVGALDTSTGQVAGFSGRGPSCYDGGVQPQIVAPGVAIRSSADGGYSSAWSGTSMAQAHVAGVAALLRAARPDLSVEALRTVLTSTATYSAGMGLRPNNEYGWGVVNALAAYLAVQPPTPTPTSPSFTPTILPTQPASPTTVPPTLTPGCAMRFDDVPPDHWAYGYIAWFYCRGIVSGLGNGRFGPDLYISRAQLTKLIVLSHGWSPVTPTTPSFSDVPRAFWAYTYIETARAHRVISGYADGTFQPVRNITRAQMAKMIVQSQGWTVAQPAQATFTDVGPGHWAYAWIETVARHSVASGYSDGTFRPLLSATRAQLSKMLYRALNP